MANNDSDLGEERICRCHYFGSIDFSTTKNAPSSWSELAKSIYQSQAKRVSSCKITHTAQFASNNRQADQIVEWFGLDNVRHPEGNQGPCIITGLWESHQLIVPIFNCQSQSVQWFELMSHAQNQLSILSLQVVSEIMFNLHLKLLRKQKIISQGVYVGLLHNFRKACSVEFLVKYVNWDKTIEFTAAMKQGRSELDRASISQIEDSQALTLSCTRDGCINQAISDYAAPQWMRVNHLNICPCQEVKRENATVSVHLDSAFMEAKLSQEKSVETEAHKTLQEFAGKHRDDYKNLRLATICIGKFLNGVGTKNLLYIATGTYNPPAGVIRQSWRISGKVDAQILFVEDQEGCKFILYDCDESRTALGFLSMDDITNMVDRDRHYWDNLMFCMQFFPINTVVECIECDPRVSDKRLMIRSIAIELLNFRCLELPSESYVPILGYGMTWGCKQWLICYKLLLLLMNDNLILHSRLIAHMTCLTVQFVAKERHKSFKDISDLLAREFSDQFADTSSDLRLILLLVQKISGPIYQTTGGSWGNLACSQPDQRHTKFEVNNVYLHIPRMRQSRFLIKKKLGYPKVVVDQIKHHKELNKDYQPTNVVVSRWIGMYCKQMGITHMISYCSGLMTENLYSSCKALGLDIFPPKKDDQVTLECDLTQKAVAIEHIQRNILNYVNVPFEQADKFVRLLQELQQVVMMEGKHLLIYLGEWSQNLITNSVFDMSDVIVRTYRFEQPNLYQNGFETMCTTVLEILPKRNIHYSLVSFDNMGNPGLQVNNLPGGALMKFGPKEMPQLYMMPKGSRSFMKLSSFRSTSIPHTVQPSRIKVQLSSYLSPAMNAYNQSNKKRVMKKGINAISIKRIKWLLSLEYFMSEFCRIMKWPPQSQIIGLNLWNKEDCGDIFKQGSLIDNLNTIEDIFNIASQNNLISIAGTDEGLRVALDLPDKLKPSLDSHKYQDPPNFDKRNMLTSRAQHDALITYFRKVCLKVSCVNIMIARILDSYAKYLNLPIWKPAHETGISFIDKEMKDMIFNSLQEVKLLMNGIIIPRLETSSHDCHIRAITQMQLEASVRDVSEIGDISQAFNNSLAYPAILLDSDFEAGDEMKVFGNKDQKAQQYSTLSRVGQSDGVRGNMVVFSTMEVMTWYHRHLSESTLQMLSSRVAFHGPYEMFNKINIMKYRSPNRLMRYLITIVDHCCVREPGAPCTVKDVYCRPINDVLIFAKTIAQTIALVMLGREISVSMVECFSRDVFQCLSGFQEMPVIRSSKQMNDELIKLCLNIPDVQPTMMTEQQVFWLVLAQAFMVPALINIFKIAGNSNIPKCHSEAWIFEKDATEHLFKRSIYVPKMFKSTQLPSRDFAFKITDRMMDGLLPEVQPYLMFKNFVGVASRGALEYQEGRLVLDAFNLGAQKMRWIKTFHSQSLTHVLEHHQLFINLMTNDLSEEGWKYCLDYLGQKVEWLMHNINFQSLLQPFESRSKIVEIIQLLRLCERRSLNNVELQPRLKELLDSYTQLSKKCDRDSSKRELEELQSIPCPQLITYSVNEILGDEDARRLEQLRTKASDLLRSMRNTVPLESTNEKKVKQLQKEINDDEVQQDDEYKRLMNLTEKPIARVTKKTDDEISKDQLYIPIAGTDGSLPGKILDHLDGYEYGCDAIQEIMAVLTRTVIPLHSKEEYHEHEWVNLCKKLIERRKQQEKSIQDEGIKRGSISLGSMTDDQMATRIQRLVNQVQRSPSVAEIKRSQVPCSRKPSMPVRRMKTKAERYNEQLMPGPGNEAYIRKGFDPDEDAIDELIVTKGTNANHFGKLHDEEDWGSEVVRFYTSYADGLEFTITWSKDKRTHCIQKYNGMLEKESKVNRMINEELDALPNYDPTWIQSKSGLGRLCIWFSRVARIAGELKACGTVESTEHYILGMKNCSLDLYQSWKEKKDLPMAVKIQALAKECGIQEEPASQKPREEEIIVRNTSPKILDNTPPTASSKACSLNVKSSDDSEIQRLLNLVKGPLHSTKPSYSTPTCKPVPNVPRQPIRKETQQVEVKLVESKQLTNSKQSRPLSLEHQNQSRPSSNLIAQDTSKELDYFSQLMLRVKNKK
jgi:hypothetical protein